MPNYCENDLTITGPAVDIERFTADGLSFETAIPYPAQFRALDDARKAHAAQFEPEHPDRHYCSDCPKDGYNQGGYDWCIANWGVKWDISARSTDMETITPEKVIIHFSTPWGPPCPVLDAWALKHPTLTLDLRYYERGMGFSGRYKVHKGKIITQTHNDKYRGTRGG